MPGGVRIGSGVSDVQAAFVTTPATVYGGRCYIFGWAGGKSEIPT